MFCFDSVLCPATLLAFHSKKYFLPIHDLFLYKNINLSTHTDYLSHLGSHITSQAVVLKSKSTGTHIGFDSGGRRAGSYENADIKFIQFRSIHF